MKLDILQVGMIRTNCYIIAKDKGSQCVVIDPGFEAERIADRIKESYEGVAAILLTHGHFDHMTEAVELKNYFHTKIYAYQDEHDLLMNAQANCSIEGTGKGTILDADEYVGDKQILSLGGFDFQVLHTPGHTGGSCCYWDKEENKLYSGDTLFFQSVGRTDLPTGSERQILESMKRLMQLPDDVQVYPGHGESTTIGYERKNNPYA